MGGPRNESDRAKLEALKRALRGHGFMILSEEEAAALAGAFGEKPVELGLREPAEATRKRIPNPDPRPEDTERDA